ncbi:hypothetical protein [Flavivirga eckloniae]|uniref:hypothetical protein n=1 Tax=Flavivirga eckloniae TaxID=1803846 RepID=UPI001315A5E0|nr:hypothetical protein [Flavivirga eckloniae]
MKKSIFIFFLVFIGHFTTHAQIPETSFFGTSLVGTSLNYNFTERHRCSVTISSANYGFDFVGRKNLPRLISKNHSKYQRKKVYALRS